MKISETLLPEFDQEMTVTRKVLERCPEAKFNFKPHAKSWDMSSLATHVANINNWGVMTMQMDVFDYEPAKYKEEPIKTSAELLEKFDAGRKQFREELEKASDEDLLKTWTFTSGGATIFSMPKITVIRSFVMNHGIHHRAQLAVYLRLTDVPVPSMYGPSADESGG